MIRILTAASLMMAPLPAAAEGCFGPGTPLFHCTVKGGAKAVDVCLQGEVAFYRFGPADGAAELLLARRVEGVHMMPWAGVGSSIYEEVAFFNGPYEYTLWYNVSRIAADNPDVTGGVTVTNGDQTLAEMECDAGSVADREFYPLYEAKEAAGQCWSRERFEWGPC